MLNHKKLLCVCDYFDDDECFALFPQDQVQNSVCKVAVGSVPDFVFSLDCLILKPH